MLGIPKCFERNCKHFLGVRQPDGTEQTEFVYCLAFPDGIPKEIAYGENNHLEKFPGQPNDIIFEKEE